MVFQTWRADQVKIYKGPIHMPVDHLGAATWCSSALIQSGHNWFEANGISFLGELLYTGNNQEVWQFYFGTLQSSATVITAFFQTTWVG